MQGSLEDWIQQGGKVDYNNISTTDHDDDLVCAANVLVGATTTTSTTKYQTTSHHDDDDDDDDDATTHVCDMDYVLERIHAVCCCLIHVDRVFHPRDTSRVPNRWRIVPLWNHRIHSNSYHDTS